MDYQDSNEALKKRQKEILDDIQDALADLKERRRSYGGVWRDPDNDPAEFKLPDSGIVMTLEVLLSYLLPLYSAKADPDFQREVYRIYSAEELANEIRNCLQTISDADFAFSGEPYITVLDKAAKPHPFVDTACLSLSLILFANRVLDLPKTPSDMTLYREVFERAMTVLDGARIKDEQRPCKGWFFTNSGLPNWHYKYCTWMATDSFSDIQSMTDIERKPFFPAGSAFSVKFIEIALDRLREELHRIYMLSALTTEEVQSLGANASKICMRNSIVQEDPDDPEMFQFNVWLLLTLLYLNYDATDDRKQLMYDAFSFCVEWLNGREQNLIDDEVLIEFRSDDGFAVTERAPIRNKLRDRAALPQWIKALSIALKRHEDWRGKFGDHLTAMIKLARNNRGEGVHVWDNKAEGKFSIYLTERYVEAFTKYYEYLGALQQKSPALKNQSVDVKVNVDGPSWSAMAERIAQEVAKHAVTIQIGPDKADALIKNLLKTELTDLLPKITDGLKSEIANEVLSQFKSQSEKLEELNSGLIELERRILQKLGDTAVPAINRGNAAGVSDIAKRQKQGNGPKRPSTDSQS